MTGFFARMGERSLGVEGALQLRLPQPYEAVTEPRSGPTAGGIVGPLPETGVPGPPRPPELEPGSFPTLVAAPRPSAHRPVDRSARTATTVSADRPEPVPGAVATEAVWAPDRPPTRPDAPSETRTETEWPEPEPTLGDPVEDRTPPPATATRDPLPPRHVRSGPEVDEPVDCPPTPGTPIERSTSGNRLPARAAVPPVDLAELLRRHVLPALAGKGVLEPGRSRFCWSPHRPRRRLRSGVPRPPVP